MPVSLSSNGTNGHTSSWSDTNKPRLLLTADTKSFDPTITSYFHEEGFQIQYLPYTGDKSAYLSALAHIIDDLEAGEKYAIVAYGQAASYILETCTAPTPNLCAVIAYYPSSIPTSSFPDTLNLVIHLDATATFGSKWHPTFRYPATKPHFAEHNRDSFSGPEARVAWSRTLAALRAGFNIKVDLETIWDHHTELEFAQRDADATMTTMVPEPYVNHVPTMTGGIGFKDLRRFYADFFIPNNPPDMGLRLLSRTVGVDRVVDEMYITFTHDREIPWMVPGVPATGKWVEIVVVGVINIRGKLLYHEHLHWDQASVLVQLGLLDPAVIPPGFRTLDEKERTRIKRLPVLGAEAARKVVNEQDGESNLLIPGW